MVEDKLSPAAITSNLETSFVGQRVIYYPRLTSTMEIARQEAKRGAAEGTTVVADKQTAGRGRMKRIWISPQGSIALSVVLYPEIVYLPFLVMLASLAVVHSIEAVTGLVPQVKWPNDVLINGKKVCGILIESEVRGDRVDHAIIGIGMNINLRLADFPEIQPIATSLSDELGREVSRLEVIRWLLKEIERLYQSLPDGESIYQEWRGRLVTLGKRVSAQWGATRYEGIAESVARDGSLLLRLSDGSLTRVVAGDVVMR